MIRAAVASDFALLISPAFAALYAGWPSAWTPFTEPMIAIAPRRRAAGTLKCCEAFLVNGMPAAVKGSLYERAAAVVWACTAGSGGASLSASTGTSGGTPSNCSEPLVTDENTGPATVPP